MMAQHGFPLGGGQGGGSIDPNDLAMSSNYANSFHNHYGNYNPSAFSSGGGAIADDELLDGLSPTEPPHGMHHDLGGIGHMSMNFSQQGLYSAQHRGMPMDHAHVNGFSSTPDGDPIQSPFVNNNFGQYRQIQQHPALGGMPFAGSPVATTEVNQDGDPNYRPARSRMSQAMQRKSSSNNGPLPSKVAGGMSMNSEVTAFGSQPIRTSGNRHHEKSNSGQWNHTPNSLSSFTGSGFSSELQAAMQATQINDILLKGGASMPAKLTTNAPAMSTQEAKRKRRRESHNLVERRRRDNINERIQDLSKLVPAHRLEDEKIKKAIQNGTPLSPTLGSVGSPTQATSMLAAPGAKRATGGTTGSITTGLPMDDKDKGPNKGDILNGAVSWTRDLMWMLHLKIQQQEELINCIVELNGHVPFELTEDERRMQTELLETMTMPEDIHGTLGTFSYSRTAGSGLRVPHHTDYKGEPINGHGMPTSHSSVSPGVVDRSGLAGGFEDGDFLDYDDDGHDDLNDLKEEDDFMEDLTTH